MPRSNNTLKCKSTESGREYDTAFFHLGVSENGNINLLHTVEYKTQRPSHLREFAQYRISSFQVTECYKGNHSDQCQSEDHCNEENLVPRHSRTSRQIQQSERHTTSIEQQNPAFLMVMDFLTVCPVQQSVTSLKIR